MKINFKIDSRGKTPYLYLSISHTGNRKFIKLFPCKPNEWVNDNLSNKHPQFTEFFPFIQDLRYKFFEWEMMIDADRVAHNAKTFINDYFRFGNHDGVLLNDVAKIKIESLTNEGNKLVYGYFLKRINQFQSYIYMDEIDYPFVQSFINYLKKDGLKNNSISNYLRSFRAIYNEYIRLYKAEDKKPFQNAFNGLTQKYTIKKYLEFSEIEKLENVNFDTSGKQKARDFFLLMFYLGGLNLKDLYFLEQRNIQRGRVYLSRSKTKSFEFDLKIFPKAQAIMDKYNFPLGDDYDKYLTFKRNLYRSLQLIQKELDIFVSPKGENLGINVARHTFSTLGVQVGANREIKALLMGHDIGDIQAYYETYSEKMRDTEHEKIIYYQK
ncbi:tyrosine-type recombinase/integrase [Ornithobacterium rhinotracheale]